MPHLKTAVQLCTPACPPDTQSYCSLEDRPKDRSMSVRSQSQRITENCSRVTANVTRTPWSGTESSTRSTSPWQLSDAEDRASPFRHEVAVSCSDMLQNGNIAVITHRPGAARSTSEVASRSTASFRSSVKSGRARRVQRLKCQAVCESEHASKELDSEGAAEIQQQQQQEQQQQQQQQQRSPQERSVLARFMSCLSSPRVPRANDGEAIASSSAPLSGAASPTQAPLLEPSVRRSAGDVVPLRGSNDSVGAHLRAVGRSRRSSAAHSAAHSAPGLAEGSPAQRAAAEQHAVLEILKTEPFREVLRGSVSEVLEGVVEKLCSSVSGMLEAHEERLMQAIHRRNHAAARPPTASQTAQDVLHGLQQRVPSVSSGALPSTEQRSGRLAGPAAGSQPGTSGLISNTVWEEHWRIPIEQVTLGALIGQGSVGMVYKGRYSGCPVAVKTLYCMLAPQQTNTDGARGSPMDAAKGSLANWDQAQLRHRAMRKVEATFMQEMQTLASVRHPNCVLFMGSCMDPSRGRYYLVSEYLTGGSLYDLLHGPVGKQFMNNASWLHSIATQIAQGMFYLHNKHPEGIVHRDLKSQNVLLDASLSTAKLADFGLAAIRAKLNDLERTRSPGLDINSISETGTHVGTPPWMAPEMLLRQRQYTEKADVYSYAMVLFEILTGEVPFKRQYGGQANGLHAMIADITQHSRRPALPASVSAELAALMRACWAQAAEERPSFEKVLTVLQAPGALNMFAPLAAVAHRLTETLPLDAALRTPAGVPVGSFLSSEPGSQEPHDQPPALARAMANEASHERLRTLLLHPASGTSAPGFTSNPAAVVDAVPAASRSDRGAQVAQHQGLFVRTRAAHSEHAPLVLPLDQAACSAGAHALSSTRGFHRPPPAVPAPQVPPLWQSNADSDRVWTRARLLRRRAPTPPRGWRPSDPALHGHSHLSPASSVPQIIMNSALLEDTNASDAAGVHHRDGTRGLPSHCANTMDRLLDMLGTHRSSSSATGKTSSSPWAAPPSIHERSMVAASQRWLSRPRSPLGLTTGTSTRATIFTTCVQGESPQPSMRASQLRRDLSSSRSSTHFVDMFDLMSSDVDSSDVSSEVGGPVTPEMEPSHHHHHAMRVHAVKEERDGELEAQQAQRLQQREPLLSGAVTQWPAASRARGAAQGSSAILQRGWGSSAGRRGEALSASAESGLRMGRAGVRVGPDDAPSAPLLTSDIVRRLPTTLGGGPRQGLSSMFGVSSRAPGSDSGKTVGGSAGLLESSAALLSASTMPSGTPAVAPAQAPEHGTPLFPARPEAVHSAFSSLSTHANQKSERLPPPAALPAPSYPTPGLRARWAASAATHHDDEDVVVPPERAPLKGPTGDPAAAAAWQGRQVAVLEVSSMRSRQNARLKPEQVSAALLERSHKPAESEMHRSIQDTLSIPEEPEPTNTERSVHRASHSVNNSVLNFSGMTLAPEGSVTGSHTRAARSTIDGIPSDASTDRATGRASTSTARRAIRGRRPGRSSYSPTAVQPTQLHPADAPTMRTALSGNSRALPASSSSAATWQGPVTGGTGPISGSREEETRSLYRAPPPGMQPPEEAAAEVSQRAAKSSDDRGRLKRLWTGLVRKLPKVTRTLSVTPRGPRKVEKSPIAEQEHADASVHWPMHRFVDAAARHSGRGLNKSHSASSLRGASARARRDASLQQRDSSSGSARRGRGRERWPRPRHGSPADIEAQRFMPVQQQPFEQPPRATGQHVMPGRPYDARSPRPQISTAEIAAAEAPGPARPVSTEVSTSSPPVDVANFVVSELQRQQGQPLSSRTLRRLKTGRGPHVRAPQPIRSFEMSESLNVIDGAARASASRAHQRSASKPIMRVYDVMCNRMDGAGWVYAQSEEQQMSSLRTPQPENDR